MPATHPGGARRWRLVRSDTTGTRRGDAVTLRRRWRAGSATWLRASGLAIAVVAAGTWVALGTSVLGVRSVEVTGAEIAGTDAVRDAAAVAAGTPLLRVDTGAVRDRVAALPSVATVDVRRSWPGTLVIAVTERVPYAVVAGDGGYLVLDAAGVVFHRVDEPPPGVAVLVVAEPGPGDPATVAGLRVLAALTPRLRSELVQVVAESADRIRLELTGSRVVVWGDADHSDQKAQVATALLDRPVSRIDVSAPDVATTD